jgi:cytochrome b561
MTGTAACRLSVGLKNESGAPLPPSFEIYPSFVIHGYIATILAGFIGWHVLAALYHQFVMKDRLFRRMFLEGQMTAEQWPLRDFCWSRRKS